MKSVYLNKEDCCGCSACYSTCPKAAIAMKEDEEGFLYPKIDEARCTSCGRCARVCPLLYEGSYKEKGTPRFYAVRHMSDDVLKRSTSGGAFTALSDAVLRQNGVIYGADYDEKFRVFHKRADTPVLRDRLRISKYVQSNMGNTYQKIKDDLQAGRKVLFTGTPCQAAGLRAYMGSSSLSSGLYICDLICHSIPSPLIWEEYKRLIEQENGGALVSVQFRSKKYGWSRENSNKGFLFTVDKSPQVLEDDRFFQLFFKSGCITRPSCSKCRFTDTHRASDLTIADYWGIEKYRPEWFNPLGISLILVNSSRGAELFTKCQTDLIYEERPQVEALKEQPRLSKPAVFPEDRQLFWENYRRFGFACIIDTMRDES